MAFYLSPLSTFLQLFSSTGIPLNGGLLWTYLAGTATPGATYTDSTGAFPNSNPLQMGSDGRLQNVTVWQQGGVAIKYVFSTNAGTTGSPVFGTQLGPPFDQVYGINDPALFLSGGGIGPFDVPFSASNFTGSGAMTWTVASNGQIAYWYAVIGTLYLFGFDITGTVGGTPGPELRIALPSGVGGTRISHASCLSLSNGAYATSDCMFVPGNPYISCYVAPPFNTNWTAGTVVTAGQIWIS